jgi:hypothetical protein
MKETKEYISPMSGEWVDITPEGILCISGNIPNYEQEDFEW